MFFFDPLYLLFMAPGLILMLWAQNKVRSTFARYTRDRDGRLVRNHLGITGAQAARQVLDANGLYDVAIEPIPGELSDHYDPRKRVLRLSQPIYNVPSIAAVAVAAHEAGHAIQHAKAYAPLQFRTAIVPVVNIGSNLGFIVLIAGILLAMPEIAWLGVILFALSTVFAFVTLPVEFDASKRAKNMLLQLGVVDGGVAGGEEAKGVDRVLDAAAWTYVAGFAASLLTLLYYIMLVTGMRRDE